MNIIIPIGGTGERFKINGYQKPKPFININGMPMLKYVINSIKLQPNDKLIIIYNKELNNFNIHDIIPKTTIIHELNNYTSGAIETIYSFLSNYDLSKLHQKTLICDCDTFYNIDILSICKTIKTNGIVCFKDNKLLPIYSYIKINDNNIINEIKEKEPISNLANTGAYFFYDINILKNYCNKVLQKKYTYNNEYYTSCVIDLMLQDKHVFNAIIINENDFNCVGTPHQLKMYALQNKNDTKRFCFDIDNTLIISDKNYDNSSIIEKNVNYLKFLKSMGHTIILYTARRMKTHNGCQGKVIADIGKKTIDCLQLLNIPYDEIYFGKPYADFYIDDLGINAYYDLEKETGYYQNNIKERNFNNISIQQLDVIVKKGDPEKIKAEIFYYNNIPQTVKHLFPLLIKYDNNSYTIEQIHGINISYLYVHGNMINDIFDKILQSLHSIHSIDNVDIELYIIYEHYINRLKQRFLDPIYSSLKDADDIYNKLLTFFNFYTNKGIVRMYHGDPVFTNIILNKENNSIFIDMRGIVNNTMSIYGDIMYDFAKIYQSLIGYDEIMHDIFLTNNNSTIFIEKLFNFVKNTYGEEYIYYIKMITYSHIFTLLPLHPYEKAIKYYSLIDKNDIDYILINKIKS